jgi:hypothetical protein
MKLKHLFLGVLFSSVLVSCENSPMRVSANDIPQWCNDIEKTGIFASLAPELLTGEKLLACGSGAENEISSSRVKATIDAKQQILDQLLGRLIRKYSEARLVDNYRDYLSHSSFGYDIVEQKVFDIEGGYQTFILIETKMDDLKGTRKALLKPRFSATQEKLVSDK